MSYMRKTVDVYIVQVLYDREYGYECVAYEDTIGDAKRTQCHYIENEPQYPSRVVKKRKPLNWWKS